MSRASKKSGRAKVRMVPTVVSRFVVMHCNDQILLYIIMAEISGGRGRGRPKRNAEAPLEFNEDW